MSDNKSKVSQQDRSRINMSEDYEVRYWTETLGVSKEQLQATVKKVGSTAEAVRKALKK
jgi:hypothetical protein